MNQNQQLVITRDAEIDYEYLHQAEAELRRAALHDAGRHIVELVGQTAKQVPKLLFIGYSALYDGFEQSRSL